MRDSKKKPSKRYSPKFYNDLDLPICVWNKVCKDGNISHLLLAKCNMTKKLSQALNNAWMNICNQHFEEFKEMYDNYIAIKQRELLIAKLIIKKILQKDESIQTLIDIHTLKLNGLKKNGVKNDFMQSVMFIEKNYHFQIDENKTSTRKFYSYLKSLIKK